MALPKAVQAQLDQAEQMEAALLQQQDTENQPPAGSADQPVETPPEPTPRQDTPPPQIDAAAAELMQKYRTLQGKYDAEIPKLHQQLAERDETLREMRAQLARLTEAIERQPEAPPKDVGASEKDIEDFGADLVDMVRRVVAGTQPAGVQTLAGEIGKIVERIARLEASVDGVGKMQGATASQLFYADLARQVPDWETINTDAAWLAWLGEIDPVYGQPRQAALDAAAGAHDVARTAAIFKAFKAAQEPPRSPAAKELEKQVAPPKSGAAPATRSQEPRVWTREEVREFYTRVRRGELSEADEARIESEINAAIAQGRVR